MCNLKDSESIDTYVFLGVHCLPVLRAVFPNRYVFQTYLVNTFICTTSDSFDILLRSLLTSEGLITAPLNETKQVQLNVDDREIVVQFPARQAIFVASTASMLAFGPTQFPVKLRIQVLGGDAVSLSGCGRFEGFLVPSYSRALFGLLVSRSLKQTSLRN